MKNKKLSEEVFFTNKRQTLFNVTKYDKFFSYLKSKIKLNKKISFKYLKNEKALLNFLATSLSPSGVLGSPTLSTASV